MTVDVVGDDLRALGVGVDAVRQVERGLAGDAFEEEGDERHFVLAGERLKGFVYLALVLGPCARRRVHPGEEDDDVALLRAFDDGGEVLLRLGDGLAAQKVVRAEFENQEAHVARVERPVEAAQTRRGGVARNTRVDDLVFKPVGVELLLQERGIALGWREAVARG